MLYNAMAILNRLPKHGVAERLDRPLAGRPAFIVSAGPSLDKNAHMLNACKERGPLLAVNTALPALAKHGVVADVAVLIENMDMSFNFDGAAFDRAALCLTAHPRVWDTVEATGKPIMWFVGQLSYLMTITMGLDVGPNFYGGNVATAAFMLARMWGADPIVLIGQDLAYDLGRGNAYAEGSGWSGLGVHREGTMLVFSGRKDRDALHIGEGVPATARARQGMRVPGWNATDDVWTTLELFDCLEWFQRESGATNAELINATEGGAHISGFEHWTLERTLEQLNAEPHDRCVPAAINWYPPCIDEYAVEHTKRELLAEAERSDRIADAFLSDDKVDFLALGAQDTPMCSGLAAGDQLGLMDLYMPPLARVRGHYEVYRAANNAIREAVG